MRRIFHDIIATALVMVGIPAISAEPAADKDRYARFLAVGDSPPFRQVIRDGVRYEVEPPLGSIPPREMIVGFGGENTHTTPLRLGRPSPRVAVPTGEGPLQLWQAGDAPDDPPWLTLKRPAAGDFLVLFWRKPAAESWQQASAMTLPETPAGMARIINLFPSAVSIEWGGENLTLRSGRGVLRPVKQDAPVTLRIMSRDPQGAMTRYYSGVVSAAAGERSLVAIHRADGVAPRRPLKVAVMREPAVEARPPAP